MKNEVWKEVFGFEGLYSISNLFNIISMNRMTKNRDGTFRIRKGKKITKFNSKIGYVVCFLYKDNKKHSIQLHRIIANAFIPNPKNKPFVNHINGVKSDNRIENLEWVTASENTIHAYSIGLKKKMIGSKNPFSILNEEKVLYIRKNYKNLGKYHISDKLGVSPVTVYNIYLRKSWKHI